MEQEFQSYYRPFDLGIYLFNMQFWHYSVRHIKRARAHLVGIRLTLETDRLGESRVVRVLT